jgi:CRISPR system Cascade subunit CasC
VKTFVEIHVVQNFAPSNLNRDDTGAPKDAMFGGARRARVSSQCVKRAVREYFKTAVGATALGIDEVGSRTKRVLEVLTALLKDRGRGDQTIAAEKVRMALAAVKLAIKEDGKSEYLLFLGQRELARIADIIDANWETIVPAEAEPSEGKKKAKTKKSAAQDADPQLKLALEEVFNGGKAVDIALFGRMLADMPAMNQDAACQVAHAISTHAVDREFDFYTAVDDLKPEDTAGADMMGTVEFNSACFYRYAVLDWDKLVHNLQTDTELAAKGARAFLEGFVVAEPTGKQNTFAAHQPPEFIAISVRRNGSPRSYANAFETPIRANRTEALTTMSANSLVSKANALNAAFGGEGTTMVLNVTGATIDGFGESVPSLQVLLDRTIVNLVS